MPANSSPDEPSVRALVRYGPDGPDILRMDDDVGDGPPPSAAVEVFKTVTATGFGDEPYGEHAVSIHCFEDVLVVHLPEEDGRGLVATFDAEARALPIDTLVEAIEGQ